MRSFRLAIVAALGLALLCQTARAADSPAEDKPDAADKPAAADVEKPDTGEKPAASPWEADVQRFEEQDRKSPPPADPILFVGSSSIRMWKLDESFPGLPALNRGFGGSQIADSVALAERIVLPYKPKLIVMYAGDNDVASGKKAETIAADYKAFVATVRAALPETPILYISIKPSVARWKLIETVRATNALIAAECQADKHSQFVDLGSLLLGENGEPRPELFVADGLHLNAEGYKLWTEKLRPLLGP